MTNVIQNVYPKDLTMSLASNHIEREKKLFTGAEDRIFVPDGGPFYSQSLIIKDNNGTILKPQVDYQLLYLNEGATIESGRDVVTVINVLKSTLPYVMLDYRVVGGEFGNTVNAIMQEITKAGPIQKNVDWNVNVYGKPVQFPPAPHYHTPDSFTDWKMVYTQLEGMRKAIIVGDDPSWESHYNYLNRVVNNLEENINGALNNYATKAYVASAIGSIDLKVDLSGYYKKTEIDTQLTAIDGKINTATNSLGTDYYTKTAADGKYALKTASYTKSESDGRYPVKSDNYTKAESDSRYALKTQLSGYITTNTLNQLDLKLSNQINEAVSGGTVDLSGYYTKTQTYAKSEVYNKNETYAKSEVYAKGEVYPRASTYSKTEVDQAIGRIPVPDLSKHYLKTETYTKKQVDDLLAGALNNAPEVDLSGYLTEAQVKQLIDSAINKVSMGIAPLAELVIGVGTVVGLVKTEGWPIVYSTKGFKTYRGSRSPTSASYSVTLPNEYDPAKHRIESNKPSFTVSGKTVTWIFAYQTRTGYEYQSGYGGERFPYTYFAVSESLSVKIFNK